MNRLSWDTTAPRRPGGKRAPQPRPEEMGLVEAEAELIRDIDPIVEFAKQLTVRYSEGIDSVEGDAAAALEAQAAKRVAISFPPARTATWDHRKLGGTY